MNPDLSNLLEDWVAVGWLRSLDGAFARFLKAQAPETSELVLLLAALTSHQVGRGHICLDLRAMLSDPEKTLSLPPEKQSGEKMSVHSPNVLANISLPFLEHCLRESPFVASGAGNTPLVLDADLLYMRRYWQYTRSVAKNILDRLIREYPVPDNLSERLDQIFEPLRSDREKTRVEMHWQSVATAIAAKSAFSVISGGPGTGKTTTVVYLLALLQQVALEKGKKLRIRMAAPTGKAAARLTESMAYTMDALPENMRKILPEGVTTLHRLLGSRPDTRHFVHHYQNPLHLDLLVVDEASMIDLEIMAALLDALPENARLILLGDKDQLASVEAGAVLGDLCQYGEEGHYRTETIQWIKRHTGYDLHDFRGAGAPLDQHIALLRKSHRFGEKSGIGALSRAVNAGNPKTVDEIWRMGFTDICRLSVNSLDDNAFAHLILDGHGSLSDPAAAFGACSNPQSAICNPQSKIGYRAYLERVRSGPGNDPEDIWIKETLRDFGAFQLLSPLRKGPWGVEGLNEKAAHILFRSELIGAEEGWYPGRPIMITRNDYSLGLMNGDTGIVLYVNDDHGGKGKTLRVVFPMPDGSLKKVLPSRLNHVETVYAMTVHKSQGSEFDHTAVVLPDHMTPVLTRELLYTAITRSREWFTLVSPNNDLLGEAVRRRIHRASGLGRLLRTERMPALP